MATLDNKAASPIAEEGSRSTKRPRQGTTNPAEEGSRSTKRPRQVEEEGTEAEVEVEEDRRTTEEIAAENCNLRKSMAATQMYVETTLARLKHALGEEAPHFNKRLHQVEEEEEGTEADVEEDPPTKREIVAKNCMLKANLVAMMTYIETNFVVNLKSMAAIAGKEAEIKD